VSGRSTPLSFLSTNSSVTHAGSTGPSEKFERREKRRKRKKAEIFVSSPSFSSITCRGEFNWDYVTVFHRSLDTSLRLSNGKSSCSS
jgi:hypothetical protein